MGAFIVVVKKTFRYSNVFFYNHLCRDTVIRNIIMESGIKPASTPERFNVALQCFIDTLG